MSIYRIKFAGGKNFKGEDIPDVEMTCTADHTWKILTAKSFQGKFLTAKQLAVGNYVYIDDVHGASKIISIEKEV